MFVVRKDKKTKENQSLNCIAKSIGGEHNGNSKCKW